MPRTIATISAIEQFIDETQTIQRTTVTAQFSPSLDDDPLHHPLFDDDDATAKSKCCCSIWQRKGPGHSARIPAADSIMTFFDDDDVLLGRSG